MAGSDRSCRRTPAHSLFPTRRGGRLRTCVLHGRASWLRAKFDSRLQIELLRAYKPDTFKTPGTQVNIGTKRDVFVLTEEQRHELIRINREFLLNSPLQRGNA